MTEPTVPVPVDLLRTLDASIRGTAWDAVQIDAPPLGAAVQALTDLIPAPPKVGDTLTAEQASRLPSRSVVVDSDGDPWIRDFEDEGRAYLYNDTEPSRMTPGYEPFILVHLGRD